MNPQLKQPKIRPALPGHRAPADRPFNAIRSYLEDQATLAETVNRLAGPIDSYYEREFDDLLYPSLYFTWQTFNSIMGQIPHENAAWHTKLAEILIGLLQRPSPSDEVRTVGEPPRILWADLPYYDPEFLGSWTDAANTAHAVRDHDRVDPDYDWMREQWTRCNAFVARLVTMRCTALDYELYAIWTLSAALEEGLHPDELWMDVPGAAVWVFYAGDFLFNSRREWEPTGNRSVAQGGPLWQGKPGFCVERWQFWKERFGAIVERDDVDEDTRSWADGAKRKMASIELAPSLTST